MNRHVEKLCEYKGENVGMREARKHTAWYMRGIKGAAKLRVMCGELRELSDMRELTKQALMSALEFPDAT